MNDDLFARLTDSELRAELERREQQRRAVNVLPLDTPDFAPVVKLVTDHVAQIVAGQQDEDMTHYIYEAAMEAVYGKQIWAALRPFWR